MTHGYKERINGRGFFTDPTGVKPNEAKLNCTQCSFQGVVSQKSLMPADQIDKKFVQRGWELDPHICPTCVNIAKQARNEARKARMNITTEEPEEMPRPVLKTVHPVALPATVPPKIAAEALFKKPEPVAFAVAKQFTPKPAAAPMATMLDSSVLEKVSEQTKQSTRVMHRMLRDHFNEDEGRYEIGWDDARVSAECGLAPHVVANERSIAYGDFKEPAEIQSLRSEIKALHEMADDVREAIINVEKRLQAFVDAQGFAS